MLMYDLVSLWSKEKSITDEWKDPVSYNICFPHINYGGYMWVSQDITVLHSLDFICSFRVIVFFFVATNITR